MKYGPARFGQSAQVVETMASRNTGFNDDEFIEQVVLNQFTDYIKIAMGMPLNLRRLNFVKQLNV